MGLWDNFKLGAAGLVDLATEGASVATLGRIPQTHLAASVYQSQTPDNLPDGKPNPAKFSSDDVAAVAEDQQQILTNAASKTVDDVADAVKETTTGTLSTLKTVGIVAGVVLLLGAGAWALHEVNAVRKVARR